MVVKTAQGWAITRTLRIYVNLSHYVYRPKQNHKPTLYGRMYRGTIYTSNNVIT